jgi:diguanylate cyclase (GGDEF)-like protein/PAS domain S-box-containing protein
MRTPGDVMTQRSTGHSGVFPPSVAEPGGLAVELDTALRAAEPKVEAVVDLLCTLIAQRVGDGAWVWLTNPSGTSMSLRGHAHRNPESAEMMDALAHDRSVAIGDGPAGHVARTKKPMMLSAQEVNRAGESGPTAFKHAVTRRIGSAGMALVPIVMHTDTIGVLTLSRDPGGHSPDDTDLTILTGLARTCAPFLAAARAREEAERTQQVLQEVSDAVISTDMRRRVTTWNKTAERLYGISEAQAVGRATADLWTDHFEGGLDADDVWAALEKTGAWTGIVEQVTHEGRHLRIMASAKLVRDQHDQPIGVVTLNRDLTEVSGLKTELERVSATARAALDALRGETAIIDSEGQIIAVNEAWRQFAREHNAADLAVAVGMNYLVVLEKAAHAGEPGVEVILAGTRRVLTGVQPRFRTDYLFAQGTRNRWFDLEVLPMPGGGAIISHTDITWRKNLEQRLTHRATHDALTGLPNRTLLSDRLVTALRRSQRHKTSVGVFFADVDGFKAVNDTFGHATGDRFLVEVAERLRHASRASDTVGRFAGDEFIIIAEDVTDENALRRIGERLSQAVTDHIDLDGASIEMRLSIGAVLFTAENASQTTVDDLLRDADIAMYEAKKSQRGGLAIFNPQMR